MVNYLNAKIYKIVCDVSNFIFVGSTCQSLNKRMWNHKGDSKRHYSKIYEYMNIIGFENFHIILIKYFPCNNREELLREERIEYDKINKTQLLNKIKLILLNRNDKTN